MASGIINPAINISGNILQILGLNNWQLETASYNGVNLMVAVPGLINVDQIPFSGAYQALEQLIANPELPYGTSLGTYGVTDAITQRIVIHEIPGRDGNFIELMGWKGETFAVECIFFGIGYQVLLQQALTYFTNPAGLVSTEDLNVLVHPVRGAIDPAYLASYKITHAPSACRAARLTLNFISDEIPTTQPASTSSYVQLYQEIQAILALIANLSSILNFSNIALAGSPLGINAPMFHNSSARGDSKNINPLIRQQLDILNAANNALSKIFLTCSNLVYIYLKPTNFSDISLESIPLDLTLLPELFRYINILTGAEISTLIEFYIQKANTTILLYGKYELDVIFPDKIDTIKNTIVELTKFSELLLSLSNAGLVTYTVPYTMSLRQALKDNNIDFNGDISQNLVNNRAVLISTNYILKGTVLSLRKTAGG